MPEIFKDVRVYPDAVGARVEWDLDPLFNDVVPFNFTLEVSEEEGFSSIILSIPVGDTYFAIDASNLKQSLTINYVYRVKLVTGAGKTYYSRSVMLGSINGGMLKFRQGAEVMRLERLTHRYAGYFGYFLKRKTYGAIAVADVDPVSGAVIADNNDNYGTCFDGGYYAPVPISFRVLSGSAKRKQSEDGMGTVEVGQATIRTIGFPKMNNEDIIVRSISDTRYNIKEVRTTSIPGIGLPVIQSCDIMAIPLTDSIYDIKMPNER